MRQVADPLLKPSASESDQQPLSKTHALIAVNLALFLPRTEIWRLANARFPCDLGQTIRDDQGVGLFEQGLDRREIAPPDVAATGHAEGQQLGTVELRELLNSARSTRIGGRN